MFDLLMQNHSYYVFSEGTKLRPAYRNTRSEAEAFMHDYENKHGLHLDCVERDKHERVYVDRENENIKFYINRV